MKSNKGRPIGMIGKRGNIAGCILVLLVLQSCLLPAQLIKPDRMPKALYFRSLPRKKFKDMESMKDVLHYDKLLMGQNIFSGNIAVNTGRVLLSKPGADGEEILQKEFRCALSFFTRFLIYEDFSINIDLYKNLNPKAVQRWTPDFSYSFGRYSWKPGAVNFGYENYEFNKYTDHSSTLMRKFLQGNFFISYQHRLPNNLMYHLKIDRSSNMMFYYYIRYAFKYRDKLEQTHGGFLMGKPNFAIAVRHTILRKLYIESSIYVYPFPKQKQPWDPDFSYGFGYFDWRPFRVSFTYGNWVINRFPWNEKEYSNYGFLDGNFRVIFNYKW